MKRNGSVPTKREEEQLARRVLALRREPDGTPQRPGNLPDLFWTAGAWAPTGRAKWFETIASQLDRLEGEGKAAIPHVQVGLIMTAQSVLDPTYWPYCSESSYWGGRYRLERIHALLNAAAEAVFWAAASLEHGADYALIPKELPPRAADMLDDPRLEQAAKVTEEWLRAVAGVPKRAKVSKRARVLASQCPACSGSGKLRTVEGT